MKKIFVLLTVLFIFVVAVYSWLGGFSKVKVSEEKIGAFELLYLKHQGPYNKVYPVIQEAEKLATDNHIDYNASFGIYYDDPKVVAQEKLRTIAGVIVNEEELEKAKPLIKEGKLMHKTIQENSYAVAEFPNKNMLSIFIALSKVYPALNEYASSHNFPAMEYKETNYEDNYIMEMYTKDKIHYYMTLPAKKAEKKK